MLEERILVVNLNETDEGADFSEVSPIEEFYKEAERQHNVYTVKQFFRNINCGNVDTFYDSFVRRDLYNENTEEVEEEII